MTNDFLVELIASQSAVHHLAFQLGCGSRQLGHSFVKVNIEIGFFGVDDADSLLTQYVHEFLVDKLHSLKYCINIVGILHVLQGTLEIVDDRQYGDDGFLAAIEDEIGLLLDGALAIVVELGNLAEELVLEACYLGICSFELLLDGKLFFLFLSALFRTLFCIGSSILRLSVLRSFFQFFVFQFFFHCVWLLRQPRAYKKCANRRFVMRLCRTFSLFAP